jgi:hypothetical protein
METVHYTCHAGHEYEYQCRCTVGLVGPNVCDACLDAERDCPECYPVKPLSVGDKVFAVLLVLFLVGVPTFLIGDMILRWLAS